MARKLFSSRSDGVYLKKIDPFMRFFPYLLRGRNSSAVYINQRIDITELKAFLNQRNKRIAREGSGNMSTLFHAIICALVRLIYERPQLNRFIIGRRLYQRHEISCSFIMKSEFKDDGAEEIVVMSFSPEDNLDSVSGRIQQEVRRVRQAARDPKSARNGIVDLIEKLMHLPRFVLRMIVWICEFLDFYGRLPKFLTNDDPMRSTIFISNLGSIDADAPFHHLYEWGTNSIFMTVGITGKQPYVVNDSIILRDSLNIAFTLDERISDGFYFARSFHRFKDLLENPALLEEPLGTSTLSATPKEDKICPDENEVTPNAVVTEVQK